jgi:membrane complex biogenesis BtpA family protein
MSTMNFIELFGSKKPLIACIHLKALPGAPNYKGSMLEVIDAALTETEIFSRNGISALIVENFRDNPFYPGSLPPETTAAMAVVVHEVKKAFPGPVGVNALRNDAQAALAITLASKADFIRVNVHTGAMLTDQGIIQGKAHETLRTRKRLGLNTLILADARVKHASPLGTLSLEEEVNDAVERGLADAIIVSGPATGAPVDPDELQRVNKCTSKPVLIGSGITPENLEILATQADGFIVGSYFKREGKAVNDVDETRVERMAQTYVRIINQA